MVLTIICTLAFASLIVAFVFRSLTKARTLQFQQLEVERALFKYENFLFLNMTQHKVIFEAIKKQRILSQLPKTVLPVGSMFEGSHIAECTDDGRIIQEMDFMLILPDVIAAEGDSEPLKCVSVEGRNPGYVNLKVLDATHISIQDTPALRDLVDPFTKLYEIYNEELFLSHKFVRMFERRVGYAVINTMGTKFNPSQGIELGMKRKSVKDFYPVMTIFLKEPIHCLIWPDSEAWPDTAVGALFDTLSAIQDSQSSLSWENQIIDIAPAILCQVPTDIKDAWLRRRRYWPDQGLVKKISSLHCYLLAKPHPYTTNKLLEWRFSFSSAELLLSSAITPWQKQVLMVVKALRRKYLQEPKLVASYHLKTVMFWVLESMPEQIRESCSRAVLLQRLIDKLLSCLKAKNLPHFFIPENNMFSHCEDGDILTVLSKVQRMRENLPLYLTEDLFIAAVTEEREEKEFEETYWGFT
ncbi:uncharacterized protein LOC111327158 isoform X2 [Stylophora pistillata]|uniref:uncharacterized protein LOC111327158 isoform X2 n=1 Tax=Stylophora pistillata TaxID=50429 RepID=UPI000C057366|nr:uncharacterized protein LOC111327158 isoform X2 [Stylophora pistillata]